VSADVVGNPMEEGAGARRLAYRHPDIAVAGRREPDMRRKGDLRIVAKPLIARIDAGARFRDCHDDSGGINSRMLSEKRQAR
jgi:hypothetical protein